LITSHVVTLYHQDAEDTDGENETELMARVSLVKGTRDELEIEWLADSLEFVEELGPQGEQCFEQLAREAWHDRMASLDQDTEADEAADHQLALYKEHRE
jgi:hypothetical protein